MQNRVFMRCGLCNNRLAAQTSQGILDAIRLHCREYHPRIGHGGADFDNLDATVIDFTAEGYAE